MSDGFLFVVFIFVAGVIGIALKLWLMINHPEVAEKLSQQDRERRRRMGALGLKAASWGAKKWL
jgi:hypothetical protein